MSETGNPSAPVEIAAALGRLDRQGTELLTWAKDLGAADLGQARILNDKGWSLVIQWGSVVLKVTAAGMFAEGPLFFEWVGRAAHDLVPELIAWRSLPDGGRAMLFRTFEGVAVEDIPLPGRYDALVAMARSTARIQAAVRKMPLPNLRTVPARDLPGMLDAVLERAVPQCRADHPAAWAMHCRRQHVDEDFYLAAGQWRNAVAEWADELELGGWSTSVDHVDLLPQNAHVLPDGRCLIYDWEQATIGVPFFSLDVLLAYAQSIDEGHDSLVLQPERSTPTQERIRESYLKELPGPLDLSLRLSPIRYGLLEWDQATLAGVPRYGVDDLVWWLSRALRRWTKDSTPMA